jgi:hypothetical protein
LKVPVSKPEFSTTWLGGFAGQPSTVLVTVDVITETTVVVDVLVAYEDQRSRFNSRMKYVQLYLSLLLRSK